MYILLGTKNEREKYTIFGDGGDRFPMPWPILFALQKRDGRRKVKKDARESSRSYSRVLAKIVCWVSISVRVSSEVPYKIGLCICINCVQLVRDMNLKKSKIYETERCG